MEHLYFTLPLAMYCISFNIYTPKPYLHPLTFNILLGFFPVTIMSTDGGFAGGNSDAQQCLQSFWPRVMDEIRNLTVVRYFFFHTIPQRNCL